MLILLPLTASMAVLGSWHAYLLAKNMTTIEYFAEERTRMSGVVRSDAWRWPYDVGLLGNIQSVFGARWLDWLRPDCSAEVITYRWAEDDVEDQQELGVGWQAGSTEAGGMTDSSSDANEQKAERKDERLDLRKRLSSVHGMTASMTCRQPNTPDCKKVVPNPIAS
eukprot:CAMPEP_0184358038 /NCGR_PEP_ID=MMETSP1089-20130417/112356_1 /TAXON_ID=38269 ORGANISM="Gloeochaete wittrockiana, Strain SAG46.84" /NCGR_SAMPLE_ID=MMETSP1089 /ASSEMBLY_ACC=CAM_ASM_000445 /LENGTH=165 /DNA_ID=CAMNT_0026696167 /DNA_START=621 /DNA_END=1115 /DNA_ORIENTATION=+